MVHNGALHQRRMEEGNKTFIPAACIFRAFLCLKCVCGRGSAPDLAGGAYSAPPDPLPGGEGARRPLPKNPTPLSAFGLDFRPFGPQALPPRNKFLATPLLPRASSLGILPQSWSQFFSKLVTLPVVSVEISHQHHCQPHYLPLTS